MFENYTQEYFNEFFSNKAREKGLDITEGSLLFNSIAMVSPMLEDCFDTLEEAWSNCWADTCNRENLIRFAQMRGLEIEEGSATRIKIAVTGELSEGATCTDGTYTFEIEIDSKESVSGGYNYIANCTENGEASSNVGSSLTIESDGYAGGVTLVSVVSKGTEDEDTEDFRERYFSSFITGGQFGNRQFYLDQIISYDGVGNAFLSYNNGTVTIKVLTDQGGVPTSSQCQEWQSQIVASLGHTVVVSPMNSTQSITVSVSGVSIDEAYTQAQISEAINKAVKEYIKSINLTFTEGGNLKISLAKLQGIIFGIEGLTDGTLSSPSASVEATNKIFVLNGGEVNVTFA